MSFILDALQKSETDRRRAVSPALAGMAIEPQRPAAPGWTWVVIALLVIALLGLAAAWWNSTRGSGAFGGAADIADDQTGPSVSAQSAGQVVAPAAEGRGQQGPREDSGVQTPTAAAEQALTGLAATAGERRQTAAAPDDRVSPAAGAQPATSAPARVSPAAPAPAVSRAALPTLSELRAAGTDIPEISLELHVYHPSPASRWVYINGGRYTEGQVTQDGIRLLEILPEGVVLNHAGRDFLLLAQ